MPIPEFYKFMRPVLESLNDGQPRSNKDVYNAVIPGFELAATEIEEMIPSGSRSRVYDRVLWSLTYLRQAGLIKLVQRATNLITPTGSTFLKTAPEVITPTVLMQFPEFAAFANKPAKKDSDEASGLKPIIAVETPVDAIATAFEQIQQELADDLLESIKSMPPQFFETLIVQLMLRLGYGGSDDGAGETLGKSGDGGVDGVIRQDKLGLDNIYLQAKCWKDGIVGSKDIQAFVGALSGQGANKGVFITTSTFSRNASEYAAKMHGFKISLVNGKELARLMIDHDLGVSLVKSYHIKRVDSDYFTEE